MGTKAEIIQFRTDNKDLILKLVGGKQAKLNDFLLVEAKKTFSDDNEYAAYTRELHDLDKEIVELKKKIDEKEAKRRIVVKFIEDLENSGDGVNGL